MKIVHDLRNLTILFKKQALLLFKGKTFLFRNKTLSLLKQIDTILAYKQHLALVQKQDVGQDGALV